MAGPRQSRSLPHCRLRPFTSYKLRLKATNDIGDSDFSSETEAVTTLQDSFNQEADSFNREVDPSTKKQIPSTKKQILKQRNRFLQ